jgi:hypothetical protein
MKIKFNGFEVEGSADEISRVSAEWKGFLMSGSLPGRASGSLPEAPRKAYVEVLEGSGSLPEGYPSHTSSPGRLFLPPASSQLPATIPPALTTYPLAEEPEEPVNGLRVRPLWKWKAIAFSGLVLSIAILFKVLPQGIPQEQQDSGSAPASPVITNSEKPESYLDEQLPIYPGKN